MTRTRQPLWTPLRAALGRGLAALTLGSGLAALALVLLPTLAAAQTELVVWHGYRAEEKAAFEKVVAAYNARNSEVKVTTLAVPYDAYPDKITAAVPRGKGPDVFIFAQDRLGGWVEAGNTIEPIDFYLDDDIEARFLPGMMDAVTYKDTIYGLPLNFKVLTMIYNKALVSTPPTTSAQLVAMAKQHTDVATGRFGLAYAYSDFYYHSAVMNAFGGGVFDANRKPTIDLPANVKSIELVMKWFKTDGILPAEPSTALITSLFNDGKAAIVFNGPWFLGEISSDIDYGLAVLPKLDEAGGKPMRPWMTIEGVYIAAPSAHKAEAFDFVDYLTNVEAARVLALEGRQTPANAAVYDDAKVKQDQVLQAFRAQATSAIPMPNLAEVTMMWSPVTTAMNTIVKGTSSPAAALATAQEEVKERIDTLLNR